MTKSLLERMDDVMRRPVPYEGLMAIHHHDRDHPVWSERVIEDETLHRERLVSLVNEAALKRAHSTETE